MGTSYTIKCKFCGAKFDHYNGAGYGILPTCIGCGEWVETDMPIRCPACRRVINHSQDEFNSQVQSQTEWE